MFKFIFTFNNDFFKDRIIKYVENQNTQEEIDEIVRKWEVPSYNLIKGLGDSNGRTRKNTNMFQLSKKNKEG